MTDFLRKLAPRYEKAGTDILTETAEVHEIFFVTKGRVGIGFEINRKKYYAVKT
jgi:hypothetical protein